MQCPRPSHRSPLWRLLAPLVAAALLAPAAVHAGPVSVSGQVLQIAPPASIVPNGGPESSTLASFFAEQQNVALTQALQVDATTVGLFDALTDLTPASLASGTVVSSYYLHADPVGAGGTVYWYAGSITFDTDILGVVALNAQLASSHTLGAAGTLYPGAGVVNGYDFGDGTDWFTISSDRRTLHFQSAAWAGADALRVITAGNAVPEPGAQGLAALALVALALSRRGPRA